MLLDWIKSLAYESKSNWIGASVLKPSLTQLGKSGRSPQRQVHVYSFFQYCSSNVDSCSVNTAYLSKWVLLWTLWNPSVYRVIYRTFKGLPSWSNGSIMEVGSKGPTNRFLQHNSCKLQNQPEGTFDIFKFVISIFLNMEQALTKQRIVNLRPVSLATNLPSIIQNFLI